MFNWLVSWFQGESLSAILGVAHTFHAKLDAFETRMEAKIIIKKDQVDKLNSEINTHYDEKSQATNVKAFIEGLIKVV